MPETASYSEKIRNLTGSQWLVIFQAPWALLLTGFQLRRLGYQETLRRIRDQQRTLAAKERPLERAREIAYALAVAIKFGPWRPRCLLRSLVLGRFLARRGIPFELRIGVPAGKAGSPGESSVDFSAHAWVECEGVVVNDRQDVVDEFSAFGESGGRGFSRDQEQDKTQGNRGVRWEGLQPRSGTGQNTRKSRLKPLLQMNPHLRNYGIFDQVIASDFPLPGLISAQQEVPDWRLQRSSGPLDEGGYEWFHEWTGPNGQVAMACARNRENYLLRFPGVADFGIDFGERRVLALPEENCPENTLAHLLMDQVFPRLFCHSGRMVIHASAIKLQNGQAVAFTGPSGFGKSSLALSLLTAGHDLITDDCLLLENRGGVVYSIASYPSIRFWNDSAEAILGATAIEGYRLTELAHYTNKQQLFFEGRAAAGAPDWTRMEAIYILNDPVENPHIGQPCIESAGGMRAVMSMIEALFALDVVQKSQVRQNFQMVQTVAGAVPVFNLSYQRDFTSLSQVIDKIVKFQPSSNMMNTAQT